METSVFFFEKKKKTERNNKHAKTKKCKSAKQRSKMTNNAEVPNACFSRRS